MLRNAWLASLALLTACGGADSTDLTAQYALRAQASAWEDRMPRVVLPGESPTCTPLIVAFAIRAGASGFPPGLTAESVSVSRPGSMTWVAPVSRGETGLTPRWVNETDWMSLLGTTEGGAPAGRVQEQVLAGVARGCSSRDFKEGDELLVGVKVVAPGGESTVLARAELSAAY